MDRAKSLNAQVADFIALVEAGKTVEAIERHYAPDVIIFENRQMARAGREACVAYETKSLAEVQDAPSIKVIAHAIDEQTGRVFLEYVIRFVTGSGKHMLLEEVACQRWERGSVTQERFYYEGFVNESDSPLERRHDTQPDPR